MHVIRRPCVGVGPRSRALKHGGTIFQEFRFHRKVSVPLHLVAEVSKAFGGRQVAVAIVQERPTDPRTFIPDIGKRAASVPLSTSRDCRQPLLWAVCRLLPARVGKTPERHDAKRRVRPVDWGAIFRALPSAFHECFHFPILRDSDCQVLGLFRRCQHY